MTGPAAQSGQVSLRRHRRRAEPKAPSPTPRPLRSSRDQPSPCSCPAPPPQSGGTESGSPRGLGMVRASVSDMVCAGTSTNKPTPSGADVRGRYCTPGVATGDDGHPEGRTTQGDRPCADGDLGHRATGRAALVGERRVGGPEPARDRPGPRHAREPAAALDPASRRLDGWADPHGRGHGPAPLAGRSFLSGACVPRAAALPSPQSDTRSPVCGAPRRAAGDACGARVPDGLRHRVHARVSLRRPERGAQSRVAHRLRHPAHPLGGLRVRLVQLRLVAGAVPRDHRLRPPLQGRPTRAARRRRRRPRGADLPHTPGVVRRGRDPHRVRRGHLHPSCDARSARRGTVRPRADPRARSAGSGARADGHRRRNLPRRRWRRRVGLSAVTSDAHRRLAIPRLAAGLIRAVRDRVHELHGTRPRPVRAARVHRTAAQSFGRRDVDGLLVGSVIATVAYLAAPEATGSGGLISERLALYPPIAVVLWLASQRLPDGHRASRPSASRS